MPASEPPDELSETEREQMEEQFHELEEEMWEFLGNTRAAGLDLLEKMTALVNKYPEEIEDEEHIQQAAKAIKKLVEDIPSRPTDTSISDLLDLL
jgi:hypothetical protein